jgi:hypothetical protein
MLSSRKFSAAGQRPSLAPKPMRLPRSILRARCSSAPCPISIAAEAACGSISRRWQKATKELLSLTHTVEISPDLIVSAGFVTFTGERDGERFSTLPDELDAGAERGAVANREPPRLAEKLGLTASSAVSAGNPTTSRHVLADDVRGVTATARHEK